MTTQRHSCITNSIPEGTLLPIHTCHPVMTPASQAIMSPGTAFQMVMGSMNQKMCRGVFVSPTEWYVDGVTRPVVVSSSHVDLDLRTYPGSHIPQTKTPPVWSTMSIMRITEVKAFETMVRKIDARILHYIQGRIPVSHTENTPTPPTLPQLQFNDVVRNLGRYKHECKTCLRLFTSSKGYERHVCGAATFSCGLCDNVYKKQSWLDKHVLKVHNNRTTTKIAVLQAVQQVPLASQRPIPPSPFRFVDPFEQTAVERTTAPATTLRDVILPSQFDDVDGENTFMDSSDVEGEHDSTSVIDESRAFTTVAPPQRRAAIYDDDDLFDTESSHHVMTPLEGLSPLEILNIAHGWKVGQEFLLTYKERGSLPAETFESHGMLHRWDYSLESPGPWVFYAEEGKPHRYCEEALECSVEYTILSLIPVAASAAFDRKRRTLNKSLKRSRPPPPPLV